jgi:hypothetical protein
MRAHHDVRDFGKADLTARFMHFGAPRIGSPPTDDTRACSARRLRGQCLRQPAQGLVADRGETAWEPFLKTAIHCNPLQ